MADTIALLRAVNLPSYGMIAMADLRSLFAKLGLTDVRTLLASGNAVFSGRGGAKAKTTDGLEALFERECAHQLGFATNFHVRTAAEWREMIGQNPFPEMAAKDPGHMLAMTLRSEPARGAAAALQKTIVGPESIRTVGCNAYIYYAEGVGRSKLTLAKIERGLGTQGTCRNWNTVLKIAAATAG